MVHKFEDFLTEKNSNDHYVDFKTTNLLADYKMLNTKLFNNELDIVPLKWMKSKNKLGVIKLNTIRNGRRIISQTIEGIGISTFYKLTRQQYLDVLAHEMIHAWISQKNIRDNNSHGRRFHAMMDDINRKFKEFNVKPTEDADAYSVSTPDNKIKEMGVLLLNNDGVYSIIVTTENNIEDRVLLDEFFDKFRAIVPIHFPRSKSLAMTAYKVRIPAITKFKYKRNLTLKSLEIYGVDDTTLLSQIKANPKIIEVNLK